MIALPGIYKDGYVKLDKPFNTDIPVKVIVTFLDDIDPITQKQLSFNDFSFTKARKITESLKSSISETIIEERRSER